MSAAPSVSLDVVEWRVDGKPSNNRVRFVPYIDARDVARLLDEWVGPENWSDEYVPGEVAGKPALWCRLSLRFKDEWISKLDVGVATSFEAQKGMVSDAFKRCGCIKWGVGRNVYELPTIWAPCNVDNNNRAWPNDQTLPAIHQELRRLGYETTGGRVAASEPEPTTSWSDEPSSGGGGPAPTGPAAEGTAPSCPKCGSGVWDNSQDPQRGNRPVFKCRDKSCDWATWDEGFFAPPVTDWSEPEPVGGGS